MRETKFRGYDKKNKKMLDMSELCFIEMGSYNSLLLDVLDGTNKDIELLQYTGLKDKNGVDIYEGDIIKSIKGNVHWIRYNELEARYKAVNKDDVSCHISKRWIDKFSKEVIGNTHENKELLNG